MKNRKIELETKIELLKELWSKKHQQVRNLNTDISELHQKTKDPEIQTKGFKSVLEFKIHQKNLEIFEITEDLKLVELDLNNVVKELESLVAIEKQVIKHHLFLEGVDKVKNLNELAIDYADELQKFNLWMYESNRKCTFKKRFGAENLSPHGQIFKVTINTGKIPMIGIDTSKEHFFPFTKSSYETWVKNNPENRC